MKIRTIRIPAILLCASVLAIAAVPPAKSVTAAVLSGNFAGSQKQKAPAPKDASVKAAVVPFHVGEQLEYRLSWATFLTAGTVRLSVVERRTLYGWDAWHFRATGSSESPLRALFTIDDEFDSYTDTATFVSHQFESYLDELGRNEKNIMELTPQGTVPRGTVASVIVPPLTRDPLNFLESIRAFDWERYPELRVPVFDGKNLYDIHAAREAADEKISVAALTCEATRIGIHVFESGKEIEHTKMAIWLQRDGARVPVVIQADLPLGTFRMELSAVQANTNP
ncbi:MAG: DUF3108 domain-containing protein [Candidatus Acidiferrales bacterium]